MNFSDYAPLAMRTLKPLPLREEQIEHALIGMCGEVGELADDVKRAFIYDQEFDATNAAVEIGDFCWYFVLWCRENYIDMRLLDEALTAKITPTEAHEDKSLLRTVLALYSVSGAAVIAEDKRGATNAQLVPHIVNLLMICAMECDTTLEDCLDTNIAKLALRYGDTYSDYKAVNRDVAAERKVAEQ